MKTLSFFICILCKKVMKTYRRYDFLDRITEFYDEQVTICENGGLL